MTLPSGRTPEPGHYHKRSEHSALKVWLVPFHNGPWPGSRVHHRWPGTFSYYLTKSSSKTYYLTQHQRLGPAIIKQTTNRARTNFIEMWGCLPLQVNRLILFPCENLKVVSEASMVLAREVLSFQTDSLPYISYNPGPGHHHLMKAGSNTQHTECR